MEGPVLRRGIRWFLRGEEVCMEGPVLRRGIWWLQKPDGKWMRWELPSSQWVEVPTPPPPPFPCEDVRVQGSWSAENYATADLELFKSAVDQLRFVTTMFWQQAGFFVLIQSGLLAVLSQSLPKGREQHWTLLVLSALGLILALFWGWVAWNRVEIINQWRCQVRRLDFEVDRHLVYESVEKVLAKHPSRRPTSATKLLPLLLALGWIPLLIASIIWSITPNS
jgi:hypothetical protein